MDGTHTQGTRQAHVKLHHFVAVKSAGVLHVYSRDDFAVFLLNGQIVVCKSRIAEAVAERVERLAPKIEVRHMVFRDVVIVKRGEITNRTIPRGRGAAGGIVFTEDGRGSNMAEARAEVRGAQHGFGGVLLLVDGERIARDEVQQSTLICSCCGVQERGLGFRQADIRAVILLARVDERLVTRADDDVIGFFGKLCHTLCAGGDDFQCKPLAGAIAGADLCKELIFVVYGHSAVLPGIEVQNAVFFLGIQQFFHEPTEHHVCRAVHVGIDGDGIFVLRGFVEEIFVLGEVLAGAHAAQRPCAEIPIRALKEVGGVLVGIGIYRAVFGDAQVLAGFFGADTHAVKAFIEQYAVFAELFSEALDDRRLVRCIAAVPAGVVLICERAHDRDGALAVVG